MEQVLRPAIQSYQCRVRLGAKTTKYLLRLLRLLLRVLGVFWNWSDSAKRSRKNWQASPKSHAIFQSCNGTRYTRNHIFLQLHTATYLCHIMSYDHTPFWDIVWSKGCFHWLIDSTKALRWREPTCHLKSSETNWKSNQQERIHSCKLRDETRWKRDKIKSVTANCWNWRLLSGWSMLIHTSPSRQHFGSDQCTPSKFWQGNVWTAATLLTAKSWKGTPHKHMTYASV